jgi:hypothetical protein
MAVDEDLARECRPVAWADGGMDDSPHSGSNTSARAESSRDGSRDRGHQAPVPSSSARPAEGLLDLSARRAVGALKGNGPGEERWSRTSREPVSGPLRERSCPVSSLTGSDTGIGAGVRDASDENSRYSPKMPNRSLLGASSLRRRSSSEERLVSSPPVAVLARVGEAAEFPVTVGEPYGEVECERCRALRQETAVVPTPKGTSGGRSDRSAGRGVCGSGDSRCPPPTRTTR